MSEVHKLMKCFPLDWKKQTPIDEEWQIMCNVGEGLWMEICHQNQFIKKHDQTFMFS